MYHPNQYTQDKLHIKQQLREAEQEHLAHLIQGNQPTISFHIVHLGRRMVIAISLAAIFILFLLLAPQTIEASDDKFDPGDNDAFYDQMVAFRLGSYYYVTGEYERAVDYYNQAIDGIPEVVFTRVDTFRCMYWYRGDAQLKAGQPDAALESYRHYLQLMGDGASTVAVEFVQSLEADLVDGTVTVEPL